MTSRPRLLVIQWLRKPGEAERRALLTAIGPTPTEARLVRGERGMVEIFYDDPAAVVEVGDTIAATTKQNARTPTSDTLQLLKRGVLPSDAPERLRLSGRNESLIYLDKRSLELQVATDPIGFSKVFFVEQDGVRLFSSEIATLTPLASGTDESSVVSFILNGAPLAGRTIFKGISILRRGNIHRFGLDRVSRERYWDYCPDKTRAADGKAADLEAMLFDTIVDAIRTQCEGKRVILPLSGGFDSSFILGVLAKVLKHPDVVCFSYTNGPAGAGSDADVAKRQATLFGYPHLDLDISGTSLVSILELNREAGQSQRAPCLEIAAYANLRQLVGDDKDAIMPFGDEFFGGGWSSYAVAKYEDVLGAVYLRSPDGLDWLEEYAIPDNVPMLKEQLREDYTALKEKMQKFPDLNRARDYIYLDYRISMNLLPLRTFSVAHWFDVCAPLLDIKVLDGLSLLAHGQRADKTFFKAMAKKFLPEVFSHVRSSHRQVLPELRSKIVRDRDALIRMAEREHWQIPGLIDARGVQRLIRSSAARGVAGAPARNRLEDQGRKLLSSLGILEKAKRLRYRYLNPFEERLDYATVLTRVLSLAQQASESGRA